MVKCCEAEQTWIPTQTVHPETGPVQQKHRRTSDPVAGKLLDRDVRVAKYLKLGLQPHQDVHESHNCEKPDRIRLRLRKVNGMPTVLAHASSAQQAQIL